jgi:hypothetical protein
MKMSKKRQDIYDKSGGKCWYCGCELVKGWHADHFLPVRRNNIGWLSEEAKDALGARPCEHPENEREGNKVPSCASCNIMKSSLSIEDFRVRIGKFLDSLNLYTNNYKFTKRYGLVIETSKPVVFWFETKGDKQ